jgi:hypothetical protein
VLAGPEEFTYARLNRTSTTFSGLSRESGLRNAWARDWVSGAQQAIGQLERVVFMVRVKRDYSLNLAHSATPDIPSGLVY